MYVNAYDYMRVQMRIYVSAFVYIYYMHLLISISIELLIPYSE